MLPKDAYHAINRCLTMLSKDALPTIKGYPTMLSKDALPCYQRTPVPVDFNVVLACVGSREEKGFRVTGFLCGERVELAAKLGFLRYQEV